MNTSENNKLQYSEDIEIVCRTSKNKTKYKSNLNNQFNRKGPSPYFAMTSGEAMRGRRNRRKENSISNLREGMIFMMKIFIVPQFYDVVKRIS